MRDLTLPRATPADDAQRKWLVCETALSLFQGRTGRFFDLYSTRAMELLSECVRDAVTLVSLVEATYQQRLSDMQERRPQ